MIVAKFTVTIINLIAVARMFSVFFFQFINFFPTLLATSSLSFSFFSFFTFPLY